MENFEGKYFGPNLILGTEEATFKTPMGKDVVKVKFEDTNMPDINIPVKALENFVTDTKELDYTQLREKQTLIIANEIIAMILEYDVKSIDLSHLLSFTGDKCQDALERASNLLWTGDDKQWIPGMSFMNERTLLEAEQILKGIEKNVSTDEQPKTPKKED